MLKVQLNEYIEKTEYLSEEKRAEMHVQYKNIAFDPDDESDAVSWSIIKHYASSVDLSGDAGQGVIIVKIG